MEKSLVKINFSVGEYYGSFKESTDIIYNMPMSDSIQSCEIIADDKKYNCVIKLYVNKDEFEKLYKYFLQFEHIFLIMNN